MALPFGSDISVYGDIYLNGTMQSGSVPAARIDSGTLAVARSWAYSGGDVTSSAGSAVLTIAANAVTYAKMQTQAQATFLMRAAGAGTGVPIAGTAAQAKTALAIAAGDVSGLATVATTGSASDLGSGTLAVARLPALTGGNVTSSAGSGNLTIGANQVGYTMLIDMAQSTFLMRAAGAGTGDPIAGTAAQAKTALAIATSDVSGLGSIATQAASSVAITGGSIAGVTLSGVSLSVSASGAQNPVAYFEHASSTFTGDVIQSFGPNSTASAQNAWQHFNSVGTSTIVFRGDGRMTLAGGIVLSTIGDGLNIRRGTNARSGVSTLVGGTVTVANTSVTANTLVFAMHQTLGGTAGFLRTTKIAATSFTITSSSGTDTSTVGWLLVESTP
jgi:hypothetical protein